MNYKKLVSLLVLIVVSSIAYMHKDFLLDLIKSLEMESQSMPFFAAMILIGLKVIATPLGFPGTPLTLLTGSVFGPVIGTVVALIGNTLGATLAFLLSRYLLRDYVQRKFLAKYPTLQNYEKRLEEKAMATVIVFRLIPLFPFNAINFLLGLTKIPLKTYIIGSFVGMIPGTFAFVALGGSLRALEPVNIIISIIGIALLVYIGKVYEKKF